MDPRYTPELAKHLEKQDKLLRDSYGALSDELHKLQVEEEMLMRKFFELMQTQDPRKRNEGNNASVPHDHSNNGQSDH